MPRRFVAYIPLLVLLVVVGFFIWGLKFGQPNKIPSALIGKPVPEFDLPPLVDGQLGIKSSELKGKVVLLNVFASWCQPCRVEHPQLMAIEKSGSVEIYGLNYKDQPRPVLAWLARDGDPYARIGVDEKGRAGINLGVYGVPETFIIDHNGIIQDKHIGPISIDDMNLKIVPLVEKLKKCAAENSPTC